MTILGHTFILAGETANRPWEADLKTNNRLYDKLTSLEVLEMNIGTLTRCRPMLRRSFSVYWWLAYTGSVPPKTI